MVTCHVRYEIDPAQTEAFERFARRWMDLVERQGQAGPLNGRLVPIPLSPGRAR